MYLFQVVAGSGVRGWLDGSSETQNWLKLLRCSHQKTDSNMRHFLQGGQLLYETIMDVPAGSELVLEPREPLNLQDMFGDSNSADERSDRETGNRFCNCSNISRHKGEVLILALSVSCRCKFDSHAYQHV